MTTDLTVADVLSASIRHDDEEDLLWVSLTD